MPDEKELENHNLCELLSDEQFQIMKIKIFFHPKSIAITLLAIFGMSICVSAAQWQFDRGQSRHAENVRVKQLLTQSPIELNDKEVFPTWSKVKLNGSFDGTHEVLVRGRYRADKYGFDVLTLFRPINTKPIWVNRGWVAAVGDATETPIPPAAPNERVEIIGLLRSFNQSSTTTGSLIALPAPKVGKIQLSELNENFNETRFDSYLQLTSDLGESPIPADLPTFSDGPHYAYTLQWSFFVLLILAGRVLIAREELRSKLSSV
jgi:surfeit locus 1 family protein